MRHLEMILLRELIFIKYNSKKKLTIKF